VGTATQPTVAAVQQKTQDFLDSGNVACLGSACVTVDPAVPKTVNGHAFLYTKVTVDLSYQLIAAQVLGLPPTANLHLVTSATMRNDNN
jgi:hypothetical protein